LQTPKQGGWDEEPNTGDSIVDFFEMSLDHLCIAGFDGYWKRLNPSWSRTLGWTREELLSRPVLDFVHPDDREATILARQDLMAGESYIQVVNRYRCKDGTYRWFEWRSVARLDRGLVYGAARDVTDQKRVEASLAAAEANQEKLQRQLFLADRMASVGTLAAGVAHEINNPLAAVTANIGMLVEDLSVLQDELPTRDLGHLRDMAVDVQAAAERIRKIVRGLKTFTRAPDQQRAVFELRAVLELAIDLTIGEIRNKARLVREYGPAPAVEGDDARLAQAFINLLVNATQAIRADDRDGNEIRVSTSTDDRGRAVVEVRDTGAGIAPDVVGRIFDPFFTTRPVGEGTGLGLWICHDVVTSMGGEIAVTSEPGKGAAFRIVLPAARASTGGQATERLRPPRGAVLVLDDDDLVGATLRRILREHDVTAVTSAREALELLDQGQRYDVILADLMMPEMSGMEFHDEVCRRFADMSRRIVFISAGAFTPDARTFLERVANERIEKPFEPRLLRELVARFVVAPK
jgi:two-component system cell cycle sensor histidine kinase/response regulator CckA